MEVEFFFQVLSIKYINLFPYFSSQYKKFISFFDEE